MAISSKKTGKEQIVEKLLVENYEQYYRLAYSYVHNEADALDIVQEGAYKAILKCDTLREVSFAGTWIYRIMLNEIFQLCRNRNRQMLCEKKFQTQEEAEPVDEKSAADLEFTELRDAMERLEPSEKNILELRYFDGMKIEEMAGVLEINVNTAKSRLYRAIEKLRRSMTG